MEGRLGISDFHLLVITSLTGGALKDSDRRILDQCAARIGLSPTEVGRIFKDYAAGVVPLLSPMSDKQRQKLLRLLVSVVAETVDVRAARDEVQLVARVGSAFGIEKRRIKSMLQGAAERYDPSQAPPNARLRRDRD